MSDGGQPEGNVVHDIPLSARAMMEALNAEAEGLHIWLRTQANAPAQRPWFKDTDIEPLGALAQGRVAAGQSKTEPHCWRWDDIFPYLKRISEIARRAEVAPIEFADRQQFVLTNPGLGGRLQVTGTIRCAVSIYNPGDVAPAHLHTPNASRIILSEKGGYTTVEGERCDAERGDVILTPNGTWHDHGNDSSEPVMWVDILDWPLLEALDCIWLDEAFEGPTLGNVRAQSPTLPRNQSQLLFGRGGLLPMFAPRQRGIGRGTSPMLRYRGIDIAKALGDLRDEPGDPHEGIKIELTNPIDGAPLFPTQSYCVQLIRPGEATWLKRETSSTLYIVMAGRGFSEIGGKRFDWGRNDIFVAPNFLWRRHVNESGEDALLYAISDAPLLEKIGQYRAQGRTGANELVQLA